MTILNPTCRYIFLFTLLLGGRLIATNSPFESAARNQRPSIRGLAAAVTQEPQLPAQAINRMTTYFEARRGSRYMEQNCAPATYPGWETLPVEGVHLQRERHERSREENCEGDHVECRTGSVGALGSLDLY